MELCLSISQAAVLLGYSTPATLYSVKAGRCFPDVAKLRKLSTIVGVSGMRPNLDWILTGGGSPMIQREKKVKERIKADLVKRLDHQPTEKLLAAHVLLQN